MDSVGSLRQKVTKEHSKGGKEDEIQRQERARSEKDQQDESDREKAEGVMRL